LNRHAADMVGILITTETRRRTPACSIPAMSRRSSPLRPAALGWVAALVACAQLPVRPHDASADAPTALVDSAECGCAPRVVQLSAAGRHVCVVDEAHAVWCWGANVRGESAPDLSDSAIARPRRVEGVTAVAVSAGWGRTCARRAEGIVQCWGLGDATEGGPAPGGPTMVPGLVDARHVAVGAGLACALRERGAVTCWAGSGPAADPFPSLPSVRGIGALRDAICALRDDGRVSCFGRGERGQRGAVVAAGDRGVNEVDGLTGATALSAGTEHACALDGAAVLWCWGANGSGQLMLGNVADAFRATRSDFARDVTVVSAGGDTTFARGRDGSWVAAGRNDHRQLQLGDVDEQVIPRATMAGHGADVDTLSAAMGFTCALLRDRSVRCWGSNAYGALGNGALGGSSATPVTPTW